jgi:hypothetical protein
MGKFKFLVSLWIGKVFLGEQRNPIGAFQSESDTELYSDQITARLVGGVFG